MFSRVLVSAGGTHEPWDDVRYLANRSTGRQGCEIARAARDLGAAEVCVVAANVNPELLPPHAQIHQVQTAAEMNQAMLALLPHQDLVVQCAAVADFRPRRVAGKITRHDDELPVMELERTEDILSNLLTRRRREQFVIGFGAISGTDEVVFSKGRQKALQKGADLLAVNRVGEHSGFALAHNTLLIFDATGTMVGKTSGTKYEVGRYLIGLAAEQAKRH